MPMNTTLVRYVTCVLLCAFAPVSAALARPYRALEGNIAIVLQDPRSLAVTEAGAFAVGVGEFFGTDISYEVCQATAIKIGAILNDPVDATTYVPSTVSCTPLTVPEQPWFYVPAQGDGYMWTTLPANTYYGILVTVKDNDGVAAVRKGKAKVALAKALGMSIGGRVNADLIGGITARLQAHNVAFYCTTIAR